VVIFHVPQRSQRLAAVAIVRGFVEAAAAKGLKCTTLSDVAAAVDEATAAKQQESNRLSGTTGNPLSGAPTKAQSTL
jgi:hypothetical protein